MKTRWLALFTLSAIPLLLIILALQILNTQAQPSKQKGVTYTTWQPREYTQPYTILSLENLAATGANWIALPVSGYQDSIDVVTITFTSTDTATDAELTYVISEAHRLGLSVMLKPHVDVRNGDWRGDIGKGFTTEAEWTAWFTSYQNFIYHYADLAETNGVEQFCVGTELVSTTYRSDDWGAVIEGVRERFSGDITYASNHSGEETAIAWWDAVDYIGVDAYYTLTNKCDPTVEELRAGWEPHVITLAHLSETWNKPIIFAEIGYRSQDCANQHPWRWDTGGVVDLQEQADAYTATFGSVFDQEWFAGMFWWEWNTDPLDGGPCDDGYTPHDKPAEDVLRYWYGAPSRPAPTPTPILPKQHPTQTMDIYTDALKSGWEDGSWWYVTRTLTATDEVYSGTHSISITLEPWGALSFRASPAFDPSPYYWLEFYIRGSPPGGQYLWVFFNDENGTELRKRPVRDCRYIAGGTIEAGIWKSVRIPLVDLNAAETRLARVSIQERRGQAGTAFWIDEVRLLRPIWEVYLPVVVVNYHP